MKKRNLFLLLLAMLTVLPLAGCNKGPVAVQIDNEKISIPDFERFYYTQLRLGLGADSREQVDKMASDPEMANMIPGKKMFMDQLISQKIIYMKAMNDKSLNKEELATIIELSTMQAVSQYYLMTILKKDIEVSDAEVAAFYNANKAQFKGTPINTQTTNMIKRQIQMEKFNSKMPEKVAAMREGCKVVRDGFNNYMDEEAKKKGEAAGASIPMMQQGAPAPAPQK